MEMAEGDSTRSSHDERGLRSGQNGGTSTARPPIAGWRWLSWALPRLVTICFIIVLFLWIYGAEGGLGTTFLTLFGIHALLMSFFVVVFTGEAVLAFSAPLLAPLACAGKTGVLADILRLTTSKWFHLTLHLTGLLCFVGGIVAIVEYKAISPKPITYPFYTMYSVHSWVAICFLGLWFFQLLGGLYIHVINPAAHAYAGKYHHFLGRVVYGVGLATCALGFEDMQSSDLAGSVPPYVDTSNFTESQLDGMGYYPNSKLARYSCACCMLLVLQALTTFFTHVQ